MGPLFRKIVPNAVTRMADRNINQAEILEKLKARREKEAKQTPAPAPRKPRL